MSTHRQNRRSTRRRLLCESLERRQLFAADVLAVPDASFDPEDINSDGIVSSSDALIIINELNWPHDRGPNSNFRGDVNRDGLITAVDALMVIHRLNQDEHSLRPSKPAPPALVHEIRSIDGTGNNLTDTELGSAGQPLQRVAAADYTDGISTPAGEDRPSAREISNVLVDSPFDTSGNDRDLSSFLYVWGQFIDHDIDLTETQLDGESFPIDVPAGDIDFDPTGTGTQQIPLTRSQFDASSGTSTDNPRQQLSFITAWIDGSMIYGSDEATTNDLRAFTGGQMRVGDDGLLPTDESGLFVAGDIRANDNTELLSMQTLFVKEHNRLAQEIATRQPQLSDEELFQ